MIVKHNKNNQSTFFLILCELQGTTFISKYAFIQYDPPFKALIANWPILDLIWP